MIIIRQFINNIISSFHDRQFYIQQIYNAKNIIFLRLFFISALITIPMITPPILFLKNIDVEKIRNENISYEIEDNNNSDLNLVISEIIRQIPEIVIDKGAAKSASVADIALPGTDKIFLHIDTNSATFTPDKAASIITITQTECIIRDNNGHKALLLGDIFGKDNHVVIDSELILNYIASAKESLGLIIFTSLTLATLYSFALQLIASLAFSFFAYILIKLKQAPKLEFIIIFRTFVIASVPPMIISFLFSLIMIQNTIIKSFFSYIVFFTTIYYLIFAYNICLEKNVNTEKK